MYIYHQISRNVVQNIQSDLNLVVISLGRFKWNLTGAPVRWRGPALFVWPKWVLSRRNGSAASTVCPMVCRIRRKWNSLTLSRASTPPSLSEPPLDARHTERTEPLSASREAVMNVQASPCAARNSIWFRRPASLWWKRPVDAKATLFHQGFARSLKLTAGRSISAALLKSCYVLFVAFCEICKCFEDKRRSQLFMRKGWKHQCSVLYAEVIIHKSLLVFFVFVLWVSFTHWVFCVLCPFVLLINVFLLHLTRKNSTV